jgi:hypothetical protein
MGMPLKLSGIIEAALKMKVAGTSELAFGNPYNLLIELKRTETFLDKL